MNQSWSWKYWPTKLNEMWIIFQQLHYAWLQHQQFTVIKIQQIWLKVNKNKRSISFTIPNRHHGQCISSATAKQTTHSLNRWTHEKNSHHSGDPSLPRSYSTSDSINYSHWVVLLLDGDDYLLLQLSVLFARKRCTQEWIFDKNLN